jgi:hypothetical protein
MTRSQRRFEARLGPRFCSCSDSPSPPPPDPAIGQAAAANAEVGREALAFSRQVYEESKPRYEKYSELVDKVVSQQLEIGDQSAALSKDYADYMKGTFRPIEQALADEAAEAGGLEDQEALAAEAGVDVSTNFEASRAAQLRDMSRVGANPNSGAYLSADTSSRVMEAASRSQAMNNAREKAKNIGWAKKMDVANVGRNLPSSQATSAGIALNAGNAAAANAGAPNAMAGQNAAQQMAGYGSSVNANTAAGGLYLGQFGAQMSGYNAQQQADSAKWGGIGSLVGTGIGAYAALAPSSKKLKHKKEKVDEEVVLKGLKKLSVEKWDYKPGIADEKTHIGAYAEDFKDTFGVGDGKTINLVDAIGVNMLAIQGLSKQVDRMEKNMTEART